MINNQFREDLAELKSNNLYRKLKVINGNSKNKILVNNRWLVNFGSNDYLGVITR